MTTSSSQTTTVIPQTQTSPDVTLPEKQKVDDNLQLQSVKTGSSDIAYTTDLGFIPIPERLRYNPAKPPYFGLLMNIAFGLGSTFIVSNLYYCQPLLIQLSIAFNVSYSEVSLIPTLVQAGYATGLVLISPLGDLLRRRQLLLCIVTISTTLSIGLAITSDLRVFQVLSYLVGAVSVTPQILVPLAADLAPEKRRASAIAFVLSGLLFGILLARVLAGVIAQFASWRVVYYFAVGVQSFVLVGCYLILPDYPAKNTGLSYFHILWTMAKFSVTEPILIQACLVNLCSSACFSNFWVTLTFLLGGPPYHYSTLVIGLFGLVGMAGVAMSPVVGHTVDRLVPWYASLVGVCMLVLFQTIQTAAGGISVVAVIFATFGLDIFRQMLQVSLTTAIFAISASARARLNAVSILSIFIGQVMGTSVGTHVFVHFGWRAGAALSMGLYGFQLFVLLLRGPHCERYTWFGWQNGMEFRKSVVLERKRALEEEGKVDDREGGSEKERSMESDGHEKVVDGGMHKKDDNKERIGRPSGGLDKGLEDRLKE